MHHICATTYMYLLSLYSYFSFLQLFSNFWLSTFKWLSGLCVSYFSYSIHIKTIILLIFLRDNEHTALGALLLYSDLLFTSHTHTHRPWQRASCELCMCSAVLVIDHQIEEYQWHFSLNYAINDLVNNVFNEFVWEFITETCTKCASRWTRKMWFSINFSFTIHEARTCGPFRSEQNLWDDGWIEIGLYWFQNYFVVFTAHWPSAQENETAEISARARKNP